MPESIAAATKAHTSLKDLCVYFNNAKERDAPDAQVDKFVGLKYADGKLSIWFPVGYRAPGEDDEKELRKDVLNLIGVLSAFGKKDEMFFQSDAIAERHIFPIHAYLFIISDFLAHGYYTQREFYYSRRSVGKISWSKTIKQVRPLLADGNAVYVDFVSRRSDSSENELVSQIHKYCVHECFEKLGCLFCSFVPQKPQLAFNKPLFNTVIQNKIGATFNENALLLFKNMLDVINYLDDNNENKDFIYGTENFHHIWERLVDAVYGEDDKETFYPKVYWKLRDKSLDKENGYDFNDAKHSSLMPDTVMITDRGKPQEKIFVLDSKYYRYGATRQARHLPDSASIVKQIAYAQYIEKQNGSGRDNIFNAFIMPADLEANQIENIGFASADYVLPQNGAADEKSYYKIHGILLDIKTLMQRHARRDASAIAKLAALIESP